MGSWKPMVQARSNEQPGSQNQPSAGWAPLLPPVDSGHHSRLAALETICRYATAFTGMNSRSPFLSVGSPGVRIPGGALCKGA